MIKIPTSVLFFFPYGLKLRVHGIQEDIQLPLAPMPVLSRPQKDGEDRDFMMEFSMTTLYPKTSVLFINFRRTAAPLRLPCAITSDNLLRPCNDYKAQGQSRVQILARLIYLTDSSEDHFLAGLALRVKLCVLLKITMVNNLVDRGIDSWEEGPPKSSTFASYPLFK
ncbi:hypothetical protein DKX38_015951 [Salix brachista]|uniref:Uncharacterized protein n=1 Tax=Salix brachista TaxID=2182728 RepID=A0A5N5L7A3_9ROSI|nr:hypothetical protein DKX38_015951 [Salix brachista]